MHSGKNRDRGKEPSLGKVIEPTATLGVAALVAFILFAAVSYGPDLTKRIFPNPPPTPTPIPSPSPAPTFEELAAIELRKLTDGRIVFNPPITMKQGQPERLEARISSQDLGPKLIEGLKGKGIPQTENIKVANVMKVTLFADNDNFAITKLSTDEQIVSGREYAQWEWTVVPRSFGEHSLHLKATATINLDRFGEKSIDVPVIDKNINVRISPLYIATTMLSNMGFWPYIFGGLSLPVIFGAIWRFVSKKKKRPAGF
jgi:hypothetical protein